MPLPIIYRSETDSPLSCTTYDANLRGTLDRSNHQGTQLSSTISDLETTVEAYNFVIALQQCCTDLTTQLTQLQEDLFGEGELSTIINTLRNELLQDISELQADLSNLESRVIITENTISSFSASIASLASAVTGLTNGKANINSPTFTGIPKAPTPTSGADSTQIATVGYVTNFSLPIGVILPYGGGTPPSDSFALAVGQAISRSTYTGLFAIFGITYGAGDGNTTFNLPNLQQRVPVGVGGTYDLGETGGAATHVLTNSEMPNHEHTAFSNPHSHNIADESHEHNSALSAEGPVQSGGSSTVVDIAGNGSGASGFQAQYAAHTTEAAFTGITNTESATTNITINSNGGGQAHNNMQPYIVLNYIVKIK
jgi:microcystin-dependent protein